MFNRNDGPVAMQSAVSGAQLSVFCPRGGMGRLSPMDRMAATESPKTRPCDNWKSREKLIHGIASSKSIKSGALLSVTFPRGKVNSLLLRRIWRDRDCEERILTIRRCPDRTVARWMARARRQGNRGQLAD